MATSIASTSNYPANSQKSLQPSTGIQDLPPEILAAAFETLIYTSNTDIKAILPFTLVCHAWHDLITKHTPRLWGILRLDWYTDADALEKRIARAKAAPLSITTTTHMQTKNKKENKKMLAQVKALADLVGNWVELDVGVEFLVSVCELDRNRDWDWDRRQREELRIQIPMEPIGCEPVLRWADMYRTLRSLTLERGRRDHEFPGAFFARVGEAEIDYEDVKLHSFTSVGLPKPWIFGFLGPNIKTLRLLRGERGMDPWVQVYNSPSSPAQKLFIALEDIHTILSRVPNATYIELERLDAVITTHYLRPVRPSSRNRVIKLPFLREIKFREILHTALVLGAICAPALQTLSVIGVRASRMWGDPDHSLASVFVQWCQPGFVMGNLHTLELVNCFRTADDDVISSMIRWLRGLKSLVRLFITQETQSPPKLEEEEGDREETHLFKALASPWAPSLGDATARREWVCPSLMILHIDIPDTPIRTLISIARARGGITPYRYLIPEISPSSSHDGNVVNPPARLRMIETQFCASADQGDIDLLRSLVDNSRCICMDCALHLPLESLRVAELPEL